MSVREEERERERKRDYLCGFSVRTFQSPLYLREEIL